MRGNRRLRVLWFVLIGLAGLILFGAATMGLWNWLMPDLFGLARIDLLQAFGLLALSRILLGGLGRGRRGGFGPGWRKRMQGRWQEMTPEERQKFREAMRQRCGGQAAPATDPVS